MPLRGSRYTRRRSNPLAGRLRDLEVAASRPIRRRRKPEPEPLDVASITPEVAEAMLSKGRLRSIEARLAAIEKQLAKDGKKPGTPDKIGKP